MTQRITLNGSVHKDLSKIIKAVSSIKMVSPHAPVSVLVEAGLDGFASDRFLTQHQEIKRTELPEWQTQFNRKSKTLELFVAGTGTVGGELLKQIYALNNSSFKPVITGICNSKQVLWKENGINEADSLFFNTHIDAFSTDWNSIIDTLINQNDGERIFVDATGSKEVAKYYEQLLSAGIHVVTPSKLANTESQLRFETLNAFEKKGAFYRYEATAGAGLPVIQTIKNLVETGDVVTKVSGVVSGTMTYIFEALEKGIAFSQAVKAAAIKGYAEPDPRDDLSGEDVARKFMILARVAGYHVERKDFEAENQTPEALRNVDLNTFFERLEDYDDFWKNQIEEATEKGEVLRYVGEMDRGVIKIGVRSVPKNSPLGSLTGTDNQISIYSEFYNQSPVIIQGPGAGKEVTAQALLNDIRQIYQLILKK